MSIKLTYECGRGQDVLCAYLNLRRELYAKEMGLGGLLGHEDNYDRESEIIVFKYKSRVIGGGRLTTSDYGKVSLPMETKDFVLSKAVRGLSKSSNNFAEFSRLAVLPEYRENVYLEKIYKIVYSVCKERYLRYLFAVAPVLQARNSALLCKRLGLPMRVLGSVEVPSRARYGHIQMHLMRMDISIRDRAQEKIAA